MEKLVEEIEQRILRHLTSRERVRECTLDLIARIGKAYADGELELAGQQWRADYKGYCYGEAIDGELSNIEPDSPFPTEGRFNRSLRLIALRPLSGTGKEEE